MAEGMRLIVFICGQGVYVAYTGTYPISAFAALYQGTTFMTPPPTAVAAMRPSEHMIPSLRMASTLAPVWSFTPNTCFVVAEENVCFAHSACASTDKLLYDVTTFASVKLSAPEISGFTNRYVGPIVSVLESDSVYAPDGNVESVARLAYMWQFDIVSPPALIKLKSAVPAAPAMSR